MNFRNPGGQLARWLAELSQYDFRIEHRSGAKHSNADGLSRIPAGPICECYVAGQDVSTLPCGGCKQCQGNRKQWETFETEVDDVLPIGGYHRSGVSVRPVRRADASVAVSGTISSMAEIATEVHGAQPLDSSEVPSGAREFNRITAGQTESTSALPEIPTQDSTSMTTERDDAVGVTIGDTEENSESTEAATEVGDNQARESQEESVSESNRIIAAAQGSTQTTGALTTVEKSGREVNAGSREFIQNTAVESQTSDMDDSQEEEVPDQWDEGPYDSIDNIGPRVDESTSDEPNAEAGASNYSEQYSVEQFKTLQEGDAELQPLLTWLRNQTAPTKAELQAQSPNTRHLWLCRSQLEMSDGVLYYMWEVDQKQTRLLVVPRSLRTEVLEASHDAKPGGHLGRDKTLAKMRRQFYWYGLGRDVQLHISTCAKCTTSKGAHRHPRAPLQNYQAGAPGDRVHLDILGPFRESEHGNRYVLMIIDQFTRWLDMVALPNQEAETIARAFFETYVVRFGVPFMVHTDQGRNFDSEMFRTFCSLLESNKTRTTPYRPSSNGQVERYNTVVLNFLRCYLAGHQKKWDQYLPVLGLAIRSTVNRSTGFTANMLMLGREVNMPVDITFGNLTERTRYDTASKYLKFLLEALGDVHSEARKKIKLAQRRQKRHYDIKARSNSFDVGDLVYKRNAAFRAGESRKLNPLYVGPYVVKEVLSPSLYRVVDEKKTHIMHHDRLKPCESREIPLWTRRKRKNIMGALGVMADPEEEPQPSQTDWEAVAAEVAEEDLDATIPYGFETMQALEEGLPLLFGSTVSESGGQEATLAPTEDDQLGKSVAGRAQNQLGTGKITGAGGGQTQKATGKRKRRRSRRASGEPEEVQQEEKRTRSGRISKPSPKYKDFV